MKKYLIPAFCVLPMIFHWILPSGIEDSLFLNIMGVRFFAPDLLYFVYVLYFNTAQYKVRKILPSKYKLRLLLLCICILAYSFVCLAFGSVNAGMITLMVNNMSFVWFSLLFLLAPLSDRQIQLTKPFMVTSLAILISEVVLFSLGLMTYRTAMGNQLKGQDFDGFMRISTTIGAATGTAVVIGLLGALCLTVYKWNKIEKIILLLATTAGVYITMSRGSSIAWTLFVVYFVYKEYLYHVSFSKKFKLAIVISLVITALFYVGVFRPILARFEHMEQSSDFSAGRDDKMDISIRMIKESFPFGYGLGQVFPEKAIALDYKAPNKFAPHNMYTLIGIELGIPGLLMYLLLIILLLRGINYKNPLSIYLWLVFLVNANTESILLDSEFAALILFAIMSITKFRQKSSAKYVTKSARI